VHRIGSWLFGVIVVQGLTLAFLAWALPNFSTDGWTSILVATLVISACQAIAWPISYWLANLFHPLVFPLLIFFFAAATIWFAGGLVDSFSRHEFKVRSIWAGLWISLGLTFVDTIYGAIFTATDERLYNQFVTRPLRRTYRNTPHSNVPGVLFLEIDGLAAPVLEQALAGGWMPTLNRWLDSGSHRLMEWEPDLSSQTSASQAGILLGDNTDIPAYRWWDKREKRLEVTSKMSTARQIEERLSTGVGLLVDNGASRWNVVSGDAVDCLCTYSTFGDRSRWGAASYLAYFLNPYSFSRSLSLFVADVIRERWQAFWQVARGVQPRIHRTVKYAFVRAATTTIMQEASKFMLTADMLRGVNAAYNTFFAYDEVAHHSGIDSPDAFKVLKKLDLVFAHLEQVAKIAPRPYRLVVLSDHGQSQGATFKQRHGETLDEVVRALVKGGMSVAAHLQSHEGWGAIDVAISEALRQERRGTRAARRAFARRMRGDEVAFNHAPTDGVQAPEAQLAASDVVVLASGNLGLVSFTRSDRRLTYDEIMELAPAVLPGLVAHPGVSFVMVETAAKSGVVIGKESIYDLAAGSATGVNPLADFEPTAADHLRRTNGFSNAPDILVMSQYDPTTGEVAAFEELVGSHGGLGGSQTRPFVLHPVEFCQPERRVVGAESLHDVMKAWLASNRGNGEVASG
jgi:uncharacterized membrane protein YvlD (DUF360 family)